jgi:sugar transferase (PEP-CTERM/EpsH1 system associated)
VKLLFLTPQLPYPPHQGTTLRNFNIVKQLAPHHPIHLLSFGTPAELEGSPLTQMCERVELAPLPRRATSRRVLETFVHPLPDMARRLASPALSDKLRQMTRENEYDVIQVEGIEMAGAWLETRSTGQSNPQYATQVSTRRCAVVFDDHNAEWALQQTASATDARNPRRWHAALYSGIQWRKLQAFERRVCLAADAVVAVSSADAAELARLDSRIRPRVIPNGVDVEYYVPSVEVCAKPLAEFSVVFTGKMDFRPNVDAAQWFADEILPLLRERIRLAHIAFVGQSPGPSVLALEHRPGIQVTGVVADVRPYIADAAVFVVPLRMGSGTRLKVLEAMAMGKAIVSTTFGISGIECTANRDVLIADTPGDFAAAIALLMRDRDRARELGLNARALAVKKYDWRILIPRFEEIYSSLRGDANSTSSAHPVQDFGGGDGAESSD